MPRNITHVVREICTSFPEAEEDTAHGMSNFRVRGKEATSVFDPRAQQALDTLQGLGASDLQSLGALARSLTAQAYFLE